MAFNLSLLGASGGGAAGAYDLLETTTLTTSASSVTFSGLGSYSDYAHLQIRYSARTSGAVTAGILIVTANGDTGSNYSSHELTGAGSSVFADSDLSRMRTAYLIGTDSASDSFAPGIIDLLNFSSADTYKTFRSLSGIADTGTLISLRSGSWRNTDSVTSLALVDRSGNNFVTKSRFSLYGIKAA